MNHHRILSTLALAALLAAPLAAGELILPLSAGTESDGTAWSTRLWVTNTGAVSRRLTWAFVAPGADGTKATSSGALTVAPGDTVLAQNLAPAGKNGMLILDGAPQLSLTPRLEARGPNGTLRASSAGPVVSGLELAAGNGTLHLHGLSHRQAGLVTDLYVINASRQSTQCTVNAYGDNGAPLGSVLRLSLPPRSLRVTERAVASFGTAGIDEARFAISCGQAFYAWARVYKPGGGELNLVTPAPALGRAVAGQ